MQDNRDTLQPDNIFTSSINMTREMFVALPENKIDFLPVSEIASKIISAVAQKPYEIFSYSKFTTPDLYLNSHTVNVSIISTIIGSRIMYSDEELTELCLCALLHDLGMVKLLALCDKPTALTEKEFGEIKKHPEKTLLLLDNIRNFTSSLKLISSKIVLQIHERKSGNGYPKGLKNIHEYARIIAIADMYEALTHPRNWRGRYIPHDALKMLIETAEKEFDESFVKMLIDAISIYPPGSYVRLSNNEIAKVIGINKGMPFKPVVSISFDAKGRLYEKKRIVDLSKDPAVSVSTALDEIKIKTNDRKLKLKLNLSYWWLN